MSAHSYVADSRAAASTSQSSMPPGTSAMHAALLARLMEWFGVEFHLVDGGTGVVFAASPNLGFWTEEEGFGVENVGDEAKWGRGAGVDPDAHRTTLIPIPPRRILFDTPERGARGSPGTPGA